MLNCPELFADKESLLTLHKVMDQEVSLQAIAKMDAEELHNYAYNLLNEYNVEIHRRDISILHTVMLVMAAGGLSMLS